MEFSPKMCPKFSLYKKVSYIGKYQLYVSVKFKDYRIDIVASPLSTQH